MTDFKYRKRSVVEKAERLSSFEKGKRFIIGFGTEVINMLVPIKTIGNWNAQQLEWCDALIDTWVEETNWWWR